MRKDKQGNDDAYTKTQYLHLTRERCRKDPEVRETNVYTLDSWRFAFTSWDRVVRNGRKLWKVSTVVASKFILHNTDGCDRLQALGTLHGVFWLQGPVFRMLSCIVLRIEPSNGDV